MAPRFDGQREHITKCLANGGRQIKLNQVPIAGVIDFSNDLAREFGCIMVGYAAFIPLVIVEFEHSLRTGGACIILSAHRQA